MLEIPIQQSYKIALHHLQVGRLQEAEAMCRNILAADPQHADSLHLLGVIAKQVGKYKIAIDLIGKAIALAPHCFHYYANLGLAYYEAGQFAEAITSCKRAVALLPESADAISNLGLAYYAAGETQEAIAAFRHAIALRPSFPDALFNLGNSLNDQGCKDEAITHYRRALELRPDFSDAWNNLGDALKQRGDINEAIAIFEKVLAINPSDHHAHSNLVLCLNYHPEWDTTAVANEHLRWNQVHAESLRPFIYPFSHDGQSERTLRVGYVSPDFCSHAVALFLEGLLEFIDPVKVTVYCYANVHRPDVFTTRFQDMTPNWRSITSLSDDEVAEMIRNDKIDILIDLAGHTANNRLLVFARKPAPVQVTWLGYANTTGLKTIDYRITDGFADPLGTTEYLHSEKLIRLTTSAWCFRPLEKSPAVVTPPAHETGYVTFGCFNAIPKVNKALIALWAKILLAIPTARFFLKNTALDELSVTKEITSQFEHFGICQDRLTLQGRVTDAVDHLQTYRCVDIVLDTYPYHGTTTTCETLWMGVPVVTLAGKTHVSRVGVSLLTNLGHPEWIATNQEEYIQVAVNLASDLPRLAVLRSSMREKMQNSPLMDSRNFAREMEAAYRSMWRTWCEQWESAQGGILASR